MENGIVIQRTTLLLLAGLLMALFIGAYVVWGTAGAQRDGSVLQTTQQVGQAQDGAPQNGDGQAVQDVYVRALGTGTYDKEQVTVKKGIPVRFHFTAENGAGCGRVLVMPAFNVKLISSNGQEAVAEFTPTEAGTYEYSCTMRMFRGTLVVQ